MFWNKKTGVEVKLASVSYCDRLVMITCSPATNILPPFSGQKLQFKLIILQNVSNQDTRSQRKTWIFNVMKTYIFFGCKLHITTKSIPSTLHNIQIIERFTEHGAILNVVRTKTIPASLQEIAPTPFYQGPATVITELSSLCIKDHIQISRSWAAPPSVVFSDYPSRFLFHLVCTSGVAWHSISG
jgi:hypothetical protein